MAQLHASYKKLTSNIAIVQAESMERETYQVDYYAKKNES